jgi:hypothetical protein
MNNIHAANTLNSAWASAHIKLQDAQIAQV